MGVRAQVGFPFGQTAPLEKVMLAASAWHIFTGFPIHTCMWDSGHFFGKPYFAYDKNFGSIVRKKGIQCTIIVNAF